MDVKTPFTLISGFLGAGKTTLINHWLSEGFGRKRMAVIVNDFGAVSVDTALIKARSDNVLELRNGCICCSLASDLARGILSILEHREFDRILMETSGVTRVAPLRRIFESEALMDRVYLDQVVILVDAVRYLAIQKVIVTINEQIQNAHVVIINRCDQANEEQIRATREAIENINPAGVILMCIYGQVSFEEIATLATPKAPVGTVEDLETENWTTCRIVFRRAVDAEQLKIILNKIPDSALRVKGFVQTSDDHLLQIHRVGKDITVQVQNESVSDDLVNTLVVIGSKTLTNDLANSLGADPIICIEPESSPIHHGKTTTA